MKKTSIEKRVFLFILGGMVLFSCERSKPEVEEKIRPVVVEKVKEKLTAPTLRYSGFSKSEKSIDVSFRVGGLIQKIPIQVGDKLQIGQVIAKLDDTDYIEEVQRAVAAWDEAVAEERRASAQYSRIKSLYESESASRDELDRARAANEAAIANVAKTAAQVTLAKQNLSYTTIVADLPYCEVATKIAEVNENVKPGEKIASLTCGRRMEVEVAVPETEIAEIEKGNEVDVLFHAIPQHRFPGRVKEVGVQAAAGGAFPVTVILDEEYPSIRAGMAARVVFYSKEKLKEPLIIIPIEAVGEDEKGNYVYLFQEEDQGDNEGIAHKKHVKVGHLLIDGIVIKEGLEEGDLVIVAGLRYLTEGKRIKLIDLKHVPKRKK